MLSCRVYFLLFGDWYTAACTTTRHTVYNIHQVRLLLLIAIVVYLVLANDTPQSVSTCYFSEWYPAECTASHRVIFLILANDTPKSVSQCHFGE